MTVLPAPARGRPALATAAGVAVFAAIAVAGCGLLAARLLSVLA